MWRVAANILNKQWRTVDKGWSSGLRVGRVANNSSPKKLTLLRSGYSCLGLGLMVWYDLNNGKRTRWNVRSLYGSGSLTAPARELARYKLDLVGVQEVRWDKGGTVRAGDFIFFNGRRKENYQFGTGFFVQHRIVSAVVCDWMSYIVLRGRW